MRIVTMTIAVVLTVYSVFTLWMRNWVRAQEARIVETQRQRRLQRYRENKSE